MAPPSTTVPTFVVLAGHPVRWRLLVELTASDRQVHELSRLVGRPQALVSYHLGRLRAGGLVSARRSSFDGRAAYYRTHLERCGDLIAATGAALHPGLVRQHGDAPPSNQHERGRRIRVLFVCTGNGSRSQIAEALLRHEAGDRVDVVSGGSHPKPIHPNTITVLLERGIDASTLRSKTYEEFATRPFDHVITLCDKVREICPEFPGHGSHRHWSVEDPSARSGTARTTLPAFRALAADLESRIRFLNLELANQSQKETHRHGR